MQFKISLIYIYQCREIKAFTLVELIVVITILAILWTIAFISLSWYSADARDSSRISDISSIKSSLELFQLDAGKYPNPTEGVNILYSGSVVWNQWTFGETVFTNTDKLNKIPTDPLSDKEYTYSVINTKNEYEIWWMVEGEIMALNPSQPSLKLWKEQNKANAWTTEATAYTSWNYNGQMTKTLSWNLCTVLSLPWIITNDTSVTDLQQIVTQKKLVYRWFNNLPSSYKTSKFKYDWWFEFTPNKLASYSDTGSCASLIDKTDYSHRVQLLKWLQDSYSGTIMNNVWEIKNILSLVIDENNPSQEVVKYAGNFVNNNLWGELIMDKDVVLTWPTVKLISSLNPNGTIAINNKLTLNNYTLSQTDIAYLTKSIMARNTCNASGSVISYLTWQWYTYSNWDISLVTPPSSVTSFCWVWAAYWRTASQCLSTAISNYWRVIYMVRDTGNPSYYNLVYWPGPAEWSTVSFWWPASWAWQYPAWLSQIQTNSQIYSAISTWLSTANLDYFLTDCSTGNPYEFISAYNPDGTIYVSHPNYWTGNIDKTTIWSLTKNVFTTWNCNTSNSVINYLSTNNYTSSGGYIMSSASNLVWFCWVYWWGPPFWYSWYMTTSAQTAQQCLATATLYYSRVMLMSRTDSDPANVFPIRYWPWVSEWSQATWWTAPSYAWPKPEWGAMNDTQNYEAISIWLKTANLNYFLNNCSSGNIYTSISSLLH